MMRKRRGQSALGVCGDIISGAWYAGPTCKACYERSARAKNTGPRSRSGTRPRKTEDEVDMTGDTARAGADGATPLKTREVLRVTIDNIPLAVAL